VDADEAEAMNAHAATASSSYALPPVHRRSKRGGKSKKSEELRVGDEASIYLAAVMKSLVWVFLIFQILLQLYFTNLHIQFLG
jgi:hypothetical protein